MSIKAEVGHVIWHDLLMQDVTKARNFYADLLGWKYQVEYASNFVWKPGEAEYPLILANGEAHGGFVDPGQTTLSRWIAYVMVKDVDAITARAKSLGATIVRGPFDTPGVGRSSVIQDLQGAVICPTFPTHNFPAPSGTFLWDELITDDVESAKRFYGNLFGWKSHYINVNRTDSYAVLKCTDDTDAVGVTNQSFGTVGLAVWVPYLATDDIDAAITNAKALDASVCEEATYMPSGARKAILADPTGAVFGLLAASEFRINELSIRA
ncbi:Anthracycline biosynthesis protein DauV [Halomicronema hongdechloris C2206]|uniref:Anthracycline biosynthesis protein DauV n=1 Tax=Halomicronema hongdechloris C2206 TaxID=1641165 RepID=A0A1Z3HJW2_9CYAN|nr:VOC family protein [Halomicronema hongdechloris]ASC70614.1 Anthracycline biosynthesis protein DauV [Halomicronema hongdechloris C2206]